MSDDKKPELHLLGGKGRVPSFDEIVALSSKLMGRDPTPAELAEARAKYDAKIGSKARVLGGDKDHEGDELYVPGGNAAVPGSPGSSGGAP